MRNRLKPGLAAAGGPDSAAVVDVARSSRAAR